MKILVVDDEAPIREICLRSLSSAGYQVSAAPSGDDAIGLLSDDWDIIVTDLSMPGRVNGIELMRRARAAGSADVILMTAYPEVSSAIEAVQAGAYDYLIKPFSPDVLLLTLKRCLEKRRLSRELIQEKSLRAELQQVYARLTQMEKVKETFGRFATPEVADYVLAHPSDYWKMGARQLTTVLFTDVRHFTPFVESSAPEDVVSVLNEIFGLEEEVIHREGGILNKFMGDGILAIFGAPLPNEDHALAAARTAIAIQVAIERLALSRTQRGLQPLRIGIEINTGEMIAGCLGTKARTEYSVIGRAVNLGARIVALAAPGQILLGPETVEHLKGRFKTQAKSPVDLPGIAGSVILSELLKSDPTVSKERSKSAILRK